MICIKNVTFQDICSVDPLWHMFLTVKRLCCPIITHVVPASLILIVVLKKTTRGPFCAEFPVPVCLVWVQKLLLIKSSSLHGMPWAWRWPWYTAGTASAMCRWGSPTENRLGVRICLGPALEPSRLQNGPPVRYLDTVWDEQGLLHVHFNCSHHACNNYTPTHKRLILQHRTRLPKRPTSLRTPPLSVCSCLGKRKCASL